jgi:hypothetical protein
MAKFGPAPKYPGGVIVWQNQTSSILCKCGCGEFITNRSARNLEKGNPNAGYKAGHIWKGRTLPDSAKQKMRENHADFAGEKNPNFGKGLQGDSNPNWQGGKKLRYAKGNSPGAGTKQDLEFRISIRKRDGQCILCGNTSRLEVHHIESWIDSESRRFDPMNCVTLCKSCHVRADNVHHKDRIRPMLIAYLDSLK